MRSFVAILFALFIACSQCSGQIFTEISLSNFMDNVSDTGTTFRLKAPLIADNPLNQIDMVREGSATVSGTYIIDGSNVDMSAWVLMITNDTVLAVTNLPASGMMTLGLVQNSTGSHAVTFSNSSFVWPGSTMPAIAMGAGSTNMFFFIGDSLGRACMLSVQTNMAPTPSPPAPSDTFQIPGWTNSIHLFEFEIESSNSGHYADTSFYSTNHGTQATASARGLWTEFGGQPCIKFDGINDHFTLGQDRWNNAAVVSGTVSCWIYALRYQTNNTPQRPLSFESVILLGQSTVDGTNITGHIWDGSTAKSVTTGWGLNLWYMLTMTWNSQSNMLYLNGILKDTAANGSPTPDTLTRHWRIGAGYSPDVNSYWDGYVDDVVVLSNYVWTIHEVTNMLAETDHR